MLQGQLPTPLLTFLDSSMNSIEGSDGGGMQVFRDELIVIRNREPIASAARGLGLRTETFLALIIWCVTNDLCDQGVPEVRPGVVFRLAILLLLRGLASKCSIARCKTVSSRSVVISPRSLGRAAM